MRRKRLRRRKIWKKMRVWRHSTIFEDETRAVCFNGWRHTFGRIRDILEQDNAWWESLYDYERDLAEFIRDSLVELDANVYSGQELEEIISILEGGVAAADFFAGTVFDALELEDLYQLRDGGWTLDDLYGCLEDLAGGSLETDGTEGFENLARMAEKLYASQGGGIQLILWRRALGKGRCGSHAVCFRIRIF